MADNAIPIAENSDTQTPEFDRQTRRRGLVGARVVGGAPVTARLEVMLATAAWLIARTTTQSSFMLQHVR